MNSSSPKSHSSGDDDNESRLRRSDLAFLAAHGVDPLDVAEDDRPLMQHRRQQLHQHQQHQHQHQQQVNTTTTAATTTTTAATTTTTTAAPPPSTLPLTLPTTTATSEQHPDNWEVSSVGSLDPEVYSPDQPSLSFLKRPGADPLDVAGEDEENWRPAKRMRGAMAAVVEVVEAVDVDVKEEEVEVKKEEVEVVMEVEGKEEEEEVVEKGEGDDEMGDVYVEGGDGGENKIDDGDEEEGPKLDLHHRYHWEDKEEDDEVKDKDDGEGDEGEEEEEGLQLNLHHLYHWEDDEENEEEDEGEDEEENEDEDEKEDEERQEKMPDPYDPDHWEPMEDYTRSVRCELVVRDDSPHRPRGAPPFATWFGEERYETDFFHNLKYLMEGYPGGTKPPFVRCPICSDAQLPLRSVPIYRPREAKDREGLPDLTPGAVLKCGHMVCRPCWEWLVKQHIEETDPASLKEDGGYPPVACPVCYEELWHPGCGCHIPAYRMPRSLKDPEVSETCLSHWGWYYSYCDDGWIDDVPPTLNDIYGNKRTIPDQCSRCLEDPTRAARVRARPPVPYEVGDLRKGYDK